MSRAPVHVRGNKDWTALPARNRDAYGRSLDALSRMRSGGHSLTVAAAMAGTTPATVRRYTAPALEQRGRSWHAKPADRLFRRMSVLTPDGRVEVTVRGSRAASVIAAHWNAVDRYLAGDPNALGAFTGRRIAGVELSTNTGDIERAFLRGELAVDDIYPH